MAGVDLSHGKLVFPPRFVPYLEKHRIFELFHELTELLVQERPKDHVKFLKDMLHCAAKRRDKPRIVFLTPPSFDRQKFAAAVGKISGIAVITRYYLEMKERQKILEGLQKRQMMMPTIEEELSCVCPEYDVGEYEFPGQPFQYIGEEGGTYEESIQKSSSTTIVSEESEIMDVCQGFRVCPCKKKELDLQDQIGGGSPRDSAGSSGEKIPTVEKPATEPSISHDDMSSGTLSCTCESNEEITIDYGILGKCEYTQNGWILVDFPEDAEEAERLCQQGVLPTHAVRIISGTDEEKSRTYKYLSKNWETVYRSVPVTDIHVNGRSEVELAQRVSQLLRIMPHRHAPMLPRILLIGSRGSGASTQAARLAQKYKMAHVDFQQEMAKVVLRDDNLSQMYKRQLATRPDPELEAAILEKILLLPKCRRRGWVLTGYPTNTDHLRMLDIMATPPNRIIFLEVPAKECFVRLFYRKTDWSNAKEYKLPVIEPFGLEVRDPVGLDAEVAARLLPHPKDDKRQIIHDIEEYYQEKEEMMKYCGRTASYVNGNATVETVFERIEQIIMNPAPPEPPRDPLAIDNGIQEAYERLKGIRMEGGLTANNLMVNPPNPIFKLA